MLGDVCLGCEAATGTRGNPSATLGVVGLDGVLDSF